MKDRFLAGEAHLQVDLRKLKLAIGAEIFVAKAAGDLEVAVESGDHEDLLEDLRRLWQCVELTGMHTAGDQKIACSLGCGLGENRRFDLKKALLAEALANRQSDVVAQLEVALHLWATKIDIAVLEADFFVLDGFFRGREWGEARVVENEELRSLNLDFTGRHLRIDGVLIAQAHLANRRDNVFRADLLAFEMAVGGQFLVQDNLAEAGAVAEVEEDEVAVIAAAVDPTHENHLLACVGGAEIAA